MLLNVSSQAYMLLLVLKIVQSATAENAESFTFDSVKINFVHRRYSPGHFTTTCCDCLKRILGLLFTLDFIVASQRKYQYSQNCRLVAEFVTLGLIHRGRDFQKFH